MKIGIDARNLVTSMTGIGRYVLEMSRHLALLGHVLYLYLPEPPKSDVRLSGMEVRISRFPGAANRMIWAQTELPRRAADDKVDVFWGPAHRLPFILDQKMGRVITIHDLVWREAPSTMRWQTWMADRFLMKPGLTIADQVVADSTATANALKHQFPHCANKLSVIYPGLTMLDETELSADISQLGIDRPYILFVGTLEPRKNLVRLLQAYASLPEYTRIRYPLVLAGGQGWRLGDLRKHVADLKIEHLVRLTGYVSDADLAMLYRGARLLAMPSLYEGFGFPIIEANARGVPTLTSTISSMPEVAGDAGVLVNPYDVQSIRDGLQELATDDLLHARLAANARANSARFEWTDSARALERILEKAVAERRDQRH